MSHALLITQSPQQLTVYSQPAYWQARPRLAPPHQAPLERESALLAVRRRGNSSSLVAAGSRTCSGVGVGVPVAVPTARLRDDVPTSLQLSQCPSPSVESGRNTASTTSGTANTGPRARSPCTARSRPLYPTRLVVLGSEQVFVCVFRVARVARVLWWSKSGSWRTDLMPRDRQQLTCGTGPDRRACEEHAPGLR